jgi:hypothetical protein
MNYLEFRSEYINTLQTFLAVPVSDNYPGLIFGAESKVLSDKLADMEEQHPDWVERIEDRLADTFQLQQSRA